MRLLLFTDTLADVNGVSRFVRNVAAQARDAGLELCVMTSTRLPMPPGTNLRNFSPRYARAMPGYANLELAIPPLRRMLREARQARPDAVHVSTPGPVGFAGRLAAKRLGVPLLGVYHTDFPAYIDHLFADDGLTWFCRAAMSRFYSPFHAVFTRSRDYADSVAGLGVARERIIPLRPGIRTHDFHPRFRDEALWDSLDPLPSSSPRPCRVIYVGRVSVEKNLPLLARAWRQAEQALRARGTSARLLIVGDGPYRAQMERDLADTPARFLGFRHDDELARIYASSDLFVFPSLTDTLGQVVMEAQASGLPVLVADQGGPREVVRGGATGLVLPGHDSGAWARAVAALAADAPRRRAMGDAAHESMREYSMERSFEHFWSVHERLARVAPG